MMGRDTITRLTAGARRRFWRIKLAALMWRHGWDRSCRKAALRGDYDDPYYDEDPDDPPSAWEVLTEESGYA